MAMLTLGWGKLVILRVVLYRLSLYFIGLGGLFLFTGYFLIMRCYLAVLVLVLVLGRYFQRRMKNNNRMDLTEKHIT